jgi:hypothetical protein
MKRGPILAFTILMAASGQCDDKGLDGTWEAVAATLGDITEKGKFNKP